jgi:BlaI family transcriptional regulator, penicillinase repressor
MSLVGLSRRERQIMEILYRRGQASVSAVRAMLRVLKDKGHVKHQAEGLKYMYRPVVNREKAKRSALKSLVDTFFNDRPDEVVAALLDVSSQRLTAEELDRMAAMIDEARREGN